MRCTPLRRKSSGFLCLSSPNAIYISSRIDVALGACHYCAIRASGVQHNNFPYRPVLIKSVFGWISHGSSFKSNRAKQFVIFPMSSVAAIALRNESIEQFCKEEEAQVNNEYSLKVRKHEKIQDVTTHQAVHLPIELLLLLL